MIRRTYVYVYAVRTRECVPPRGVPIDASKVYIDNKGPPVRPTYNNIVVNSRAGMDRWLSIHQPIQFLRINFNICNKLLFTCDQRYFATDGV